MELYPEIERFCADIHVRYPPGLIEGVIMVIGQIVGFFSPATIYLLIPVILPEFSRRHRIQATDRQPRAKQLQHRTCDGPCPPYMGALC
jgi:hypothetical protein